jgi:hypothetical protein
VAEGYGQMNFRDERLRVLLASPYMKILKNLRNALFHYQPHRFNDKLLGFLTEECFLWAKELNSELNRWFEQNVKETHLTVGALLRCYQRLCCQGLIRNLYELP